MSGKEFWKVRDYVTGQGGGAGRWRWGSQEWGWGEWRRNKTPPWLQNSGKNFHALITLGAPVRFKTTSALLPETRYFRNGSPKKCHVWKRLLSWTCHWVLCLCHCSVTQRQNIHHIYIASAEHIFLFYCLPCGWHLGIECLENWTWLLFFYSSFRKCLLWCINLYKRNETGTHKHSHSHTHTDHIAILSHFAGAWLRL